MVLVEFKSSNQQINHVTVKGHAEYNQYGKDIVCAGISAIVFGTLNALSEMEKQTNVTIKKNNNPSEIMIIVKKTTDINQTILRTMLLQLKTIEENYQAFLQIMEVA